MSGSSLSTSAQLLRHARQRAFPAGEFIGQESFVTAAEVLTLARRAGIAAGVEVLDVCCGVAGPGLFLAEELRCTYTGVDSAAGSIVEARRRAGAAGVSARFVTAQVPPLPAGSFDVVLLLETMLAFRDQQPLLTAISSALPIGGRFACTVEEGRPLTMSERDLMPGADTVWLTTLPDLLLALTRAGLRVTWQVECTDAHAATAAALAAAYADVVPEIPAGPGRRTAECLVASHRLWSRWLRTGRVRKFAVVAERLAD